MRMIGVSIEYCVFGLLEHGVNRDESTQTGAEWHIGYCSFDGIAAERDTGISERIAEQIFP